MASVQRKPNGRYLVRWREPDGRQRWLTFSDRPTALAHARAVEHHVGAGTYALSAGRLTFAEYAAGWLEAGVWRGRTFDGYGRLLRIYVLPTFGRRPLAEVRTSELQALIRRIAGERSVSTVRNVGAVISAVFGAAVLDRLIPVSPWVGVKMPEQVKVRRAPMTPDEVRAIAASIAPHYRAAVLLAASAGLRAGEVFGLTADRIDFKGARIIVDRQLIQRVGHPYGLGPPKTRASVREVPVPAGVLELLAEHTERFGVGEWGLQFFSLPNRHHVPLPQFSERWATAVRRSGVGAGSRFHDLRHFYASLLIRAGLSVKVVQARLGHATAAETLDTYAHLWPDDEDRTRSAVAAVGLFDQ